MDMRDPTQALRQNPADYGRAPPAPGGPGQYRMGLRRPQQPQQAAPAPLVAAPPRSPQMLPPAQPAISTSSVFGGPAPPAVPVAPMPAGANPFGGVPPAPGIVPAPPGAVGIAAAQMPAPALRPSPVPAPLPPGLVPAPGMQMDPLRARFLAGLQRQQLAPGVVG